MTDTIFALATPAGKSGVAIFRISGGKSAWVLDNLGVSPLPSPRLASLRNIKNINNGSVIDSAIVLWFPAPASYTGEDVVELHIHGGRAIIAELTQYLAALEDVRIAEPGEFSRRAFDNGKMDLTMLEGVADLIDAETLMQKKQALRQMNGELEVLYEGWRGQLITVLAHIEAYVDFPDEDIPEDIAADVTKQVRGLRDGLQKHLLNPVGERLRSGLYAAIVGAPNVGKSSLMNLFARRDVAIVSDIAGTTRDVIEVHLDLGGYPLTLADTAGLRESKDDIEAQGVKLALQRAEHADITLCLFDSQSLSTLDAHTLGVVDNNSVIVINKCDIDFSLPKGLLAGREYFCISVETGQGVDVLIAHLQDVLSEQMRPASDPVFTRERHRAGLNDASEALDRFLAGRLAQQDIELCAEDLRMAARALGSITGRIDVEDLLDEIFSSFCIGK